VTQRVPLRLGPIALTGAKVRRSGLRWLRPDGAYCAAGQPVAFCNVGVQAAGLAREQRQPFAEEVRDLQIAFAPSHGGVLHRREELSLGGDLDQLHFFQAWDDMEIAAELETEASDAAPQLRLTGLAGRRVTELAEDRSGLLTGWHNRARAWHAEATGHLGLLSLGICEQNGIFRGEGNDFAEMLALADFPLHVLHAGDEALVPVSRTLIEQAHRKPEELTRIAEDMMRGLAETGLPVGPSDLLFAGCALAALGRSPLTERCDLLTRSGIAEGGIGAVVLSIYAEPKTLLRHKRLGYHAFWHRFRIAGAGRAVREWLQTAFEQVPRSRSDIARDLTALRALTEELGIGHMLIINAMSSSGHEDIVSYQPFAGPLGDQIGAISNKETNLMLHDLADSVDIEIVDADAIAAALGGGANLPDGVHQSRRMQAALRAEILHLLRERGAFVHAR
jgi:hypothetical protein